MAEIKLHAELCGHDVTTDFDKALVIVRGRKLDVQFRLTKARSSFQASPNNKDLKEVAEHFEKLEAAMNSSSTRRLLKNMIIETGARCPVFESQRYDEVD